MALFPTVFESEWVAHLQERAGLDADTEIGFSEPHALPSPSCPGPTQRLSLRDVSGARAALSAM